jgi:hypothetical protein
MNRSPDQTIPPSPEVVAQRIKDFRRAMYDHRTPAVVVYHPPHHKCPWPDCDFRILGISFEFSKMGGRELCERLTRDFWLGPGVVGRCPACGRSVRFDVEGKAAVREPLPPDSGTMPDDWHRIARLHVRPAAPSQPDGVRVEPQAG